MLKIIAVITMTIDHLGAILFIDNIVFRIIGRTSFPIFSYLIVLGVESTRNVKNYLFRLLLFALISQVPFYLALGREPFEYFNIFFTLFFGVLFLIDELMILLPVCLSFFIYFDYGLYGIAMIYCMKVLKENTKAGIVLFVLLSAFSMLISPTQAFSLFALPILLLHKHGFLKIEREIYGNNTYPTWRKYLFYVYYPLHLTMIYLAKSWFF
ncbi:hypothetical protein KAX03_01525 [Candidatus Bathyarchaeota archaeon]|nr:hypothetical protein [Candidatus Bathyarchaeota archaeon]